MWAIPFRSRETPKCRKDSAPWAWSDIYQSINAIASGSTFTPWNRRDGQTIVCCTDGIRPVVFNVEAEEE
ncbi:TIGR04076 family protein [Parablautia muri]|uniref:TIGR04076 family protein n=1 Tax=Parablautia muri TaxID=2320879 RepID=UPI002FE6C98D